MKAAAREKTIVEKVQADGSFKILVQTLRATGRIDLLRDPDAEYTLFAPSDRAFKLLAEKDALQPLLKDKSRLIRVIDYHILPARVVPEHIDGRKLLRTLNGRTVLIDTAGGFTVNGTHVVRQDIECGNGVIHEIDAVLLPH